MSKNNPNIPARSCGELMKRELAWIAVVLAGSTAPLLAVLATGHTLAWRDTSRLLAPIRSLVVEALRNFQLPLWNPHEALGVPLFAQIMHGVLHPWSLIAAVVAKDGTDLLIVLHVAAGAVGAGVLGRTLGASRSGAIVAGFGYGLSGYFLSMCSNLTFLAGAGSAPWAVAGLRHAARGGAARIVLGSLGVAVLHFAGDPQWAIVAALLGMLLAWEACGWRGIAKAAAATVAGTALAGIQLVPAWEFLKHSTRSEGLSLQDRTQWAFLPGRLVEFVVPGFVNGKIGPTYASVFRWLGGGSRFSLPFVPSVFIGLPVLALAVSGLQAGRKAWLLGGAAVFFLWLALGQLAGADNALGWVPVWGQFRFAEKLIGPFTLCVTLLAALGLEPFVARVRSNSRPLLFAALAAGLLASLTAGLVRLAPPMGMIPGDVWTLLGGRLAAGFLLAALGLTAIGFYGLPWGRKRQPAYPDTTTLVLATVLATGLCGSVTALHAGSRESRARLPLQELHAVEPVPRIMTPVGAVDCPTEECKAFDGLDALQAIDSRAGLPPYAIPAKVDNFSTYTGLIPRRLNDLMIELAPLEEAKFIAYRRLLALTHVVLPPTIPPSREHVVQATTVGGRLHHVDPRWQISVVAVPHRPWASFAESVVPVAGESEARRAVARLAYAEENAVVLLGQPPAALSRGVVHAVERNPSTVKILAEAPGEGLLVVADAFWEGWKATVDGRPAEILVADGLLRAVRWPAGRHLLEMRYEPVEVKRGAMLTGGAALLLAGIVLAERLRKRRTP